MFAVMICYVSEIDFGLSHQRDIIPTRILCWKAVQYYRNPELLLLRLSFHVFIGDFSLDFLNFLSKYVG
jgi:hypothetical protein